MCKGEGVWGHRIKLLPQCPATTFGIAIDQANLSTISADLKGCGLGVNNVDYTGILTGKLKLSNGLHIQNSTKLKSKTKQS